MTDNSNAGSQAVADHEHQAWQGAATLYADHIAFMTAQSGQLELLQEVGNIDDQSTVLDVGCGPGLLATQINTVVDRVVGIDFAANMIAEASKRFPDIEFHERDAEQTGLSDDSFDSVVVCYCAHHLARPHVVFTELYRVLKPGGTIVVIHPIQSQQGSWGSFARAVDGILPPETVPGGALLDVEDPEDLVTLLSDCGFNNPFCQVRLKPVEMQSLDTLLTAGWAVTGLDAQPSDVQDKIRAATVANAAPYKRPDGSFEFPDKVLLAWAQA
jgi:SAM-dependent methyltransferase